MRSKSGICTAVFLKVVVLVLGAGSTETCVTAGPVLTDKEGKPIWLTTDELIERSTHCVAPKMPPLLRQARFEGQVLVDVLVNEKGKVGCAKLISGHPLLACAAIDAAKEWTFHPKKQGEKEVSFYGRLSFHFSISGPSKSENRCIEAHF
jgi:TonB family protein